MPAVLRACPPPAASAAVVRTPASATSRSAPTRRAFTVILLASILCRERSRGYVLLLLPPARAVRERELGERLGPDLDAVARRRGREIAPVDDADRSDEVLVQVVDEFADVVVERRSDRDEVEHRHVLRVFAEADAACVRTHGHAE